MKKILILLAAGFFGIGIATASPAGKSAEMYIKGIAAEESGDITAARQAYSDALRLNPHHANARYRLGQLKINSKAILAKNREKKVGSVVIPEIHLEDATVKDSIEALAIMVEKESKGEVVPNFVLQDTKGKFSDVKVSFQLKNLPTRAVLEYILREANARARYEEHAVVISPK